MKTKAVFPVESVKTDSIHFNSKLVKYELNRKIDINLSIIHNQRKRLTIRRRGSSSEFMKCNMKAKKTSHLTEENLSTAELLHYTDSAMKLQQNAYEAAVTTNQAYNVQLLLIFLEAFISFTFNCYYLISVIAQPTAFKLPQSESVAYLLQHLIQPFVCVMVTVVGFAMLRRKFSESQQIVNKIIIYAQDNDIRTRFSAFLQQIQVNAPNFNIFGFFSLDGSVIFSMISAITTYLIILVQTLGGEEDQNLWPSTDRENASSLKE